MKRPVLIIIGVVLILLLVAAWIYILFFQNNSTDDSQNFADLNFGDTTDTTYDPNAIIETNKEPVVDTIGNERLRQLTTKPVVGYQDIMKSTSSNPFVYYVEAGTGHLFSIDLTTGQEKRISGTTIPSAYDAAITPNGRFVMLQSGTGNSAQFVIGEISSTSESISVVVMDERIISFTDTTDNTFLYAVLTSNSVIAKEYNPVSATTKTLFTVPFREAIIAWGKNARDSHYVYPKATTQLEGFVYQVANGVLNRLPIDGYGLSAAGNTEGVLYSKKINGEEYKSFIYNITEKYTIPRPLAIIPEKCVAYPDQETTLLCGVGSDEHDQTMPDSWYKGLISFSDDIWLVSMGGGSSRFLLDVESEIGRAVDMIDMHISGDGSRAYFINSQNSALWLVDLKTLTY